ncbi:hypothetical protein ACFWHQ_02895 [Streptomyces sp. NPDC060334]|uniref:hypothetical protein n=1 Tax=Streptomyces sp. NPDC060334 TaxID=3347099 RepID=UPI00365D0576
MTQDPLVHRPRGEQAHLPAERPAIAVATAIGPNAPEGNTAHTVAERIATALAPAHPLER